MQLTGYAPSDIISTTDPAPEGDKMLGYFRPGAALSAQSKRQYRIIYCSLCHSLRNTYGRRAALLLQNDPLFFALQSGFMPSVDEEKVIKKRCVMQPKRVEVLVSSPEVFEPLADLSLITVLFARWDKELDERRGVKSRLFDTLFRGVFAKLGAKLRQRGIPLDGLKRECMKNLELERKEASNPLERLEGFVRFASKLIAEFFTSAGKVERSLEIAREMLRVMYLIDALEDYHSDRRHGDFNVLFGHEGPNLAEYVEDSVYSSLEAISLSGKFGTDRCLTEIIDSTFSFVVGKLALAREKYNKGVKDA